MSFTNARESAILNNEYGAVAAGTVATRHAALFNTAPADDGSGVVEVSGGSYARVAVTNNPTEFPAANPKLNANPITFPVTTAPWGLVRAMGWYDASSGGNLLSWGWLCDMVIRMAVGLNAGDIVHAPGHSFTNGMRVIVWAPQGVTLPAGLSAGQEYFVINAVAGQNLQLSLTDGGAAVAITADGAMTIARSRFETIGIGSTPAFQAGGFSHELD